MGPHPAGAFPFQRVGRGRRRDWSDEGSSPVSCRVAPRHTLSQLLSSRIDSLPCRWRQPVGSSLRHALASPCRQDRLCTCRIRPDWMGDRRAHADRFSSADTSVVPGFGLDRSRAFLHKAAALLARSGLTLTDSAMTPVRVRVTGGRWGEYDSFLALGEELDPAERQFLKDAARWRDESGAERPVNTWKPCLKLLKRFIDFISMQRRFGKRKVARRVPEEVV